MSEMAVHQAVPEGVYEPSLFGTYSKKIGMWLFLLSDSLTFGALLWAYTYGRVSTPNWPTPFHSASIINATVMTAFLLTSSLTMVLAVRAAVDGDLGKQRIFLIATMVCGLAFVILHAREWHNLIGEGLTLPVFPTIPGHEPSAEFADVAKNVPQFPATFFGLTGMHMLHVTLGVIYLGIIAFRRAFVPVLFVLAGLVWFAMPAWSPFRYGAIVLLLTAIVCAIVVFVKPKKYDAADIEVAGLYWHFVDLVWMFIFPLVYLMSTKIT